MVSPVLTPMGTSLADLSAFVINMFCSKMMEVYLSVLVKERLLAARHFGQRRFHCPTLNNCCDSRRVSHLETRRSRASLARYQLR